MKKIVWNYIGVSENIHVLRSGISFEDAKSIEFQYDADKEHDWKKRHIMKSDPGFYHLLLAISKFASHFMRCIFL